jgi:plasmid stability protein
MAVNLSIKGVPEDLAERLRVRAERNHRSLQGELMQIIERAAAESLAEAPLSAGRGIGGSVRGSKTIEQIAAEHRLRFPRPISTGPLAVDIVRADRDAR